MSNTEFLKPIADEARAMARDGRSFIEIVDMIQLRTGVPSYSAGVVVEVFRLAFGLSLRELEVVWGCKRFGGSLMSIEEANQWFEAKLAEHGSQR